MRCEAPGCKGTAVARRRCSKHYARLWRAKRLAQAPYAAKPHVSSVPLEVRRERGREYALAAWAKLSPEQRRARCRAGWEASARIRKERRETLRKMS